MIIHMKRRGFTIIELIIVVTIMGILLTIGVVNLRGSQANGRDAERKVDVDTIAFIWKLIIHQGLMLLAHHPLIVLVALLHIMADILFIHSQLAAL